MTGPKVLMACPTWKGELYALPRWAEAYRSQTYGSKGALQIDNSDGPMHGGNLHYVHTIRAEGIAAIWQQTRFPVFWDTIELSWTLIVEYAHAHGYDFIFSCEADVIVPPEAMQKLLDCAQEHGADGKPAVVTQRYHPRGQVGPNFYWDTLGCSLFPVEPLYADLYHITNLYEIDVFVTCEKAGHPRYRAGQDGPDLFEVDHMKDPDDPYGSDVGATPANVAYTNRVAASNRALTTEEEAVEEKPKVMLTGAPAVLDVAQPVAALGEQAMPIADVMGDPEKAKQIVGEDRIRLNIGSDWSQISGFLSVDFNPKVSPDIVADGKDLSMFEDDTVDEIYASHILEHFTWDDGLTALKEWLRVLKPGGMLTVACPDIDQIYYMYKHGQVWGEYRLPMNANYVQAVAFGANLLAKEIPEMTDMYGGPGHQHQSIYIHDMLLNRVIEAGYVYAHEVTKCFLRGSAIGETMVQARKPIKGE